MLALLKFKLDEATQKDFVQLPQLQVHRLFRVWDTFSSAPYTQHSRCRRQCCFMYGGDNVALCMAATTRLHTTATLLLVASQRVQATLEDRNRTNAEQLINLEKIGFQPFAPTMKYVQKFIIVSTPPFLVPFRVLDLSSVPFKSDGRN